MSPSGGSPSASRTTSDVESLLCRRLYETNGEIDAAQRGIVYIDEIDKLGLVTHAASWLVEDPLRRAGRRNRPSQISCSVICFGFTSDWDAWAISSEGGGFAARDDQEVLRRKTPSSTLAVVIRRDRHLSDISDNRHNR
jgi:hypothetical protein